MTRTPGHRRPMGRPVRPTGVAVTTTTVQGEVGKALGSEGLRGGDEAAEVRWLRGGRHLEGPSPWSATRDEAGPGGGRPPAGPACSAMRRAPSVVAGVLAP